jgi:6-pyruvoyltetrahydropterin/6-carboxytetrahydropterin synthase
MASIIRVTKEFSFEMAHALWNYDGPCRNVHGHSYRLFVTITGVPVDDPEDPKNGMVIDFSDLKRIVKKEIVTVFDHAVVVSRRFDKEKTEMFTKMFGNTVLVDFAGRIARLLPSGMQLHSLKLYETATSFAEWFDSDN